MLAKSETGAAAVSVQKWVIDSNVEIQLRSAQLKLRLLDKILSHGSVELSLRCPNLTAIGWDGNQAFSMCTSLLRVDLSALS